MSSKQRHSEVDAIKSIDDALSRLTDEDARQRVIEWAASKYKVSIKRDSESEDEGGEKRERPGDIKAFITKKKPKTHYERVACLAYYLEKVEDKSELTTRDISKANTDARQPKLTNPSVFVRHAMRSYGFLTSLGHGKYGLSSRGEAVVEALPDQAKVKETLKAHPFRRRWGKGKRGKKK